MQAIIQVEKVGMGLSIQDSGRPGWRRYGVAPGGPMDAHAMALANRLVGNHPHVTTIELMLQGARLKFLESTWVALGGAPLARNFPTWTARFVEAGERIDFMGGPDGVWAYLAVPGGFLGDRYFGSVSVDSRSGIGKAITQGEILYASRLEPKGFFRGIGRRLLEAPSQRTYPEMASFELLPGPQLQRFLTSEQQKLFSAEWVVSPRSDRTGYRLEGPRLKTDYELHSEPVLPGSFQVTTGGNLIVTLNYGPTVGGYPKIAVLQESDLSRFVQCRPRTRLKFVWKS